MKYGPKTFHQTAKKAYENKKKNARQRGVPFELTLSQFKKLYKTDRCFYSAIPIFHARHGSPIPLQAWTLERLDSTKGYTRENCVACCNLANMLRHSLYEQYGDKKVNQEVFDTIFRETRARIRQ